MKIEYRQNGDVALFNGWKFRRDKKSGYYLKSNAPRRRLHRAVWGFYHGDIPSGYNIHHKDENKGNNEIFNLEMLTHKEHRKWHGANMSDALREKLKDNLEKNARPKAIEWHKSDEGRAWHRLEYEKRKDAFYKVVERECSNCKKIYMSQVRKQANYFCSNSCKSAHRRKSGIDNETRRCIVCNGTFTTNKYSKAKCCTRLCTTTLGWNKRN